MQNAPRSLWDLDSGNCICSVGNEPGSLNITAALGPCGMIVTGSDESLRVWDAQSKTVLQTLRFGAVDGSAAGDLRCIFVSVCGTKISAGFDDRVIRWAKLPRSLGAKHETVGEGDYTVCSAADFGDFHAYVKCDHFANQLASPIDGSAFSEKAVSPAESASVFASATAARVSVFRIFSRVAMLVEPRPPLPSGSFPAAPADDAPSDALKEAIWSVNASHAELAPFQIFYWNSGGADVSK
jgi:hypothetical protein